ncbi:MAG: ABC transporter ATP-binding protein [Alphaproteobacteria bacterium]|nr:ABC transporter ATP-binding protein [Alphaproteobacteria bacterium]
MNVPLLEVENLVVHFPLPRGVGDMAAGRPRRVVRAVNGVSLAVRRGEALGIVGESGCGKSTLGRAMLHLVPATSGHVRLDGRVVAGLDREGLTGLRRRAQIVFQDPHASLDPRQTVRRALAEVLTLHRLCPRDAMGRTVDRLLERVGLSAALGDRRPGSLSGGQCQRVGIARALALNPDILVADECVSALDVSIQAQILNLLLDLQAETGMAIVFISHDLGVVRHLCHRVAIMYLGRLVEEGPAEVVLRDPRHPYTRALIASIPGLGHGPKTAVQGEPSSPIDLPAGCAFHRRCAEAMEVCRGGAPPARQGNAEHGTWCHLPRAGGTTPIAQETGLR